MESSAPDRLQSAFPAPVLELCARLQSAGYQAWLVGGALRDRMLGREASDYDVATSALPDQVARVFGRRRTIPTGAAHGTVTVLLDEAAASAAAIDPHVEVTTFRGEGAYSDGRRPESVRFLDDIVEDLRRRDFTINAIAYDPARGVLTDPFGGQADLDARVVRAVGAASERFGEDGLRVMRAVRFTAQLGFSLDPATEAAIPGALEVLRKVSAERVRDELLKLLGAARPSEALRTMARTGVLGVVLPELTEAIGVAQNHHHRFDVFEHTLHTVDETQGDAILRLGALLHDVAKPRTAAPKEGAPGEYTFYRHEFVGASLAEQICRRLKLANKERDRVVALVEHHMFWYSPEWTDASVRRFIGRVGLELLPDLFALREGDVRARGNGEDPQVEIGELKRRIDEELAAQRALKVGDLAIGGADVMRVLGRTPGPIVGQVLRALLDRVIEDPALNDRAALEALVPEVAAAVAAQPGSGGAPAT